jgi:enoyl-CoA hydratase/carnithine racemase
MAAKMKPMDEATESEPAVLITRPIPGVCVLTFNRPKLLNAISAKFAYEIYEHAIALQKDDSVRCVVLTAKGRGFCAGADVSANRRLFYIHSY